MQDALMSVQITIRGVSDHVRDELAARAALDGQSMEAYLRRQLELIADRPSVGRVLARIRERKRRSGTRVTAAEILAHRDEDRR